jgi:hypothetical protein
MNQTEIAQLITETFKDVHVATAGANMFFFQDPERKFPFTTIVADDSYDTFSNLKRENVYRLNIGVGKQTFQDLFGPKRPERYDSTALDRIMPHPVYGNLYWICVLNPSQQTFQRIIPMLTEAYQLSVARYGKPAMHSK